MRSTHKTAILKAAKNYQRNRDVNARPWNKLEDLKKVFAAMEAAGCVDMEASAGTFSGTRPCMRRKPMFVLSIGFASITMGHHKSFTHYWNTLGRARS